MKGQRRGWGGKIGRTVHEKAPGWRTQSLLRKDSGTILKVDSVGEESEGESCDEESEGESCDKAAEVLTGHTGHVNGVLNLIKSNEKLLKQFKQR